MGKPVITKYGIDVVVKIIFSALIFVVLVWVATQADSLRWGALGVGGVLVLFTLYFFRDPERTTPAGEDLIVSPADGKVVLIKELQEDEFLKDMAVQVSIFLSPLDVHVNRVPVSGTIQYFKYVPGKYIVAFKDKSSDANERTHIGIEKGKCKVLLKQVAGFVARRIVADIAVGREVAAGARFGMIKFGSRVDVLMPITAQLRVRLRDRVIGGETILAVIQK